MVDAAKPPIGEAAKAGGLGLKDKPGDEELKPKKPPPKPAPASGRSIGRGLIVAALLVSSAWLVQSRFSARYQLVPVHEQENTFMYRLDTFSGAVHFCTTQQCVELPVK